MLRRNLIAAAGLAGLRLAYGSPLNSSLGLPAMPPRRFAWAHARRKPSAISSPSKDDGYIPSKCAENTRSLIERGVFALSSYVGTPTCLAAWPAIIDSGMPFVGAFTGAEALRSFNPNIFHTRASYRRECEILVRQLMAAGDHAEIAIFRQNDAYGQAIEDGITYWLARRGKKPALIVKVERNSVDVSEAAAQIEAVAARGITITGIALGTVYAAAAALKRRLGALGRSMMWASVSFIGTSGITKNLKTEGTGFGISQVVPYPWLDSAPLSDAYRKASAQFGSGELSYGGREGYGNGVLVLKALEKCGPNLTRQEFVNALETRHDLGGFVQNFSSASHQGSEFVELSVIWRDGQARRF